MNIKGVIKYLFKVFRRSYIFIFGFLGVMFFSTSTFMGTIEYGESVGEYLKMQEFGLLTIVCVISAINIFNFNIEESEFEYLIKDRFKYFIGGLIASIFIGLILSLIPLIYILSFMFTDGINNMGNVFIEFIFVYVQAIIIMACVSTILCFLLNGVVKRLTSISIAILLMSSVFEMLISDVLSMDGGILSFIFRTLNVHDDFDLTRYSSFFGFSHGIDFFIDKIIIIFIVMGIFYYLFKKENKLKYKTRDFAIGIGGLILIVGLGYISYSSYSVNAAGYMEEVIETNSYAIESYDMDLNLNQKLKSNVRMNLNFEESTKTCEFYLDELFEVDKVLVNDKEQYFNRDFEKINIEFKEAVKGKVKIDISYSGKVNRMSGIKDIESIVSKKNVYLNNEMINWYPRIKDGKESEFTINLNDEDILSNLKYEKGVFKGKSTEVILLKGNLEKVTVEGYDIYTTSEKNLSRDLEVLKVIISEAEEKEKLIEDIKERKQIILSNGVTFKVLNGMVIS